MLPSRVIPPHRTGISGFSILPRATSLLYTHPHLTLSQPQPHPHLCPIPPQCSSRAISPLPLVPRSAPCAAQRARCRYAAGRGWRGTIAPVSAAVPRTDPPHAPFIHSQPHNSPFPGAPSPRPCPFAGASQAEGLEGPGVRAFPAPWGAAHPNLDAGIPSWARGAALPGRMTPPEAHAGLEFGSHLCLGLGQGLGAMW